MSIAQPTRNTVKKVGHIVKSNSAWHWFQKAIVFTIFSLVLNHLATRESFPDSESYRFPVEGFLASIALCILIGIIADLNFKFYKRKHFSKKVETATIVWFMASTLGYIIMMYIPLNIIINIVAGAETEFYYLLIGLLLTLLLSFILVGLLYARDLYNLYKLSIKDAEITIESGAKMTKLTYENILCFFIENKIVYTVQNDGTTINTDFTLNELEEKINDQLFFRANRKIIIHKDAVDQIEKIENGKLRLRLKASIENDAIAQIIISRYKRKAFMDWFQ
ncbi:LytR/AlgR family response regulator transcription factor [Salinimicrobium flavum]|uniref:LytR/AlgR family response regulator transcription factor n=1 Tax=Salinimicrobium flavum TaxID=1737065 RepID=A0ABW5IXL7_9FLAO